MKTRSALAVVLTALFISVATAQREGFHVTIDPPDPVLAVTGKAYSYEEVSENTRVLADGTRVPQPARSTKLFRDSAGRTRREVGLSDGMTIIHIYDVVAGHRYVMDSVNKVAHRSAIPSQQQDQATRAPSVVPKVADTRPRPRTTSESLGTQVMEGLTCEGRIYKTTYPVGARGNDQPLVSTSEEWRSKELWITVLSKVSDPVAGQIISQIKNLRRAEPEYSLFLPPPDYQIVDETGAFTITINRSGTQQ